MKIAYPRKMRFLVTLLEILHRKENSENNAR